MSRSSIPGAIDAAILPLLEEPAIPMGTLKKKIENPHEMSDPNVVKVVTDRFRERHLFFAFRHTSLSDPLPCISNTWDCTFTAGIFS